MNVVKKTIPYVEQRYTTCGDYWLEPDGTLQVRVNSLGNEDMEFLIEMHERIEEHLTRRRGLSEPEILAFDHMWEAERTAGKHADDEEPGHDPRAPYNKEHVFAENIERLLAAAMGISWPEYDRVVEKSCEPDHPTESKPG